MPENSNVTDEEVSTGDEPLLKPSLREFPWTRVGATAVGTLLVEYLFVALIFEVGPSSLGIQSTRERLLQYVFFVYNAHLVPTITKVTAPGTVVAGSPSKNVLLDFLTADVATSTPPELFFAMPVVLLVLTGWLVERYRPGKRTESGLEEAALVGTGIAVGYAITGLVGVFVFVRRLPLENGVATESPALLWTLVAMVLFPMVFGTAGALLADTYRSRDGSLRDLVGR